MNKNSIAAIRCSHLGKILSNFSILGAVLCIATFASALLYVVYFVILIAIMLITLFTVLANPEFVELLQMESAGQILQGLYGMVLPIAAPATLAVSVLSVILLAVSRPRENIPRLVISSLGVIIGLVFTAVTLSGVIQ